MSDTKWCPTCGAEYVAGITVCADDGTPLVGEPPPPPPSDPAATEIDDDDLDAVEFDLAEWSETVRSDLEWMLRGANMTFEWIEEAVLAVPGSQADAVEEFLEYLAAGPPEEVEAESDEWRVTGPETGPGSNELSADDFYDGDQARLDSEESTFGSEWSDADGVQCEVDWVHETGELYLMKAPKWMPYMVEILDVVETEAEVEQLLRGWEAAMPQPNSVQWVRDRVAARASMPSASDDVEEAPDPGERARRG